MDKALVIGIADYGFLNQNLPGCAADRQEWADYLRVKLNLNGAALRVLADGAATRDAIVDGVRWLLADTGPDDERVMFFAGHGARLSRGGGEPLQETLVASPGATQRPYDDFMIYDADLARMIDEAGVAPKARVTLIFDSCHSGGMLRELILSGGLNADGALPRCLYIPEETKALFSASLAAPFARTFNALERNAETPRLVVAAATAQQSAWDDRMPDGKRHGVFSFYSVKELKQAPTHTIAAVMAAVSAQIATRFPQSPQLLGDQSRFDQPLF